jgi:hypothetical protein
MRTLRIIKPRQEAFELGFRGRHVEASGAPAQEWLRLRLLEFAMARYEREFHSFALVW